MSTVAIFGGRSEIGLEIARRLAAGNVVVLASRPGGDQPEVHGAKRVLHVDFDADDVATHQAVVTAIEADAGPIDIAVLTFGVLGDQALAETDAAEVVRIVHTDFVAQASLLTVLANLMKPVRPAPWWRSRRWPGSGCAGRTTSTDRPRQGWTGSRPAWRTPCTAAAST